MTKPKGLLLDGRPILGFIESPGLAKLIGFLHNSPKDELFSTGQLASKIGLSPRTLFDYCKSYSDRVAGYRHTFKTHNSKKIVWGNLAAILELKRQMGEE